MKPSKRIIHNTNPLKPKREKQYRTYSKQKFKLIKGSSIQLELQAVFSVHSGTAVNSLASQKEGHGFELTSS